MTGLLIIGKNGQVARSLADEAAKRNIAATTLARPDIDLEIPDSIETAITKEKPSAIINAAAYTAVDQAEQQPEKATLINAVSTGELARITAALGIPFLHLSTDYVFSGTQKAPYTETDKPNPMGVYGQSKRQGEDLVFKMNPGAMIFRTAWVYSPYGHNFLKTMLKLGKKRANLSVVADQFGCPTSARDIASALLNVLEIQASKQMPPRGGGLYHLVAHGSASWFDFAAFIFAEAQKYGFKSPALHPIETKDYPTLAPRPKNSILNCEKVLQDFNISLPDWRESVQACIKELMTDQNFLNELESP